MAKSFFSAGYGPFRRFTGGDPDYEKQLALFPKLARHVSLFDERVALTESLAWLQELRFKVLERDQEAAALLRRTTELVNESNLLPHGVTLREVTSAGVLFTDEFGQQFAIDDLSDGYRSILSLTFDIVRQLAIAFGPEAVFDPERPGIVVAPGIVLIDEIDVHLHPSWQRTVGQWFRSHFPRVQFIVTTHSPLACQAAEVGTVFRLPEPNNEHDSGRMLEGNERARLLYGNVLEAYGTEAFGDSITRSESSKLLVQRLAELNQKELTSELSDAERREQEDLRAIFPTTAHLIRERDSPS